MKNVALQRGRSDFFEVVVDSVNAADRNVDIGDDVDAFDRSIFFAVNGARGGSHFQETVGLCLNQLVVAWRKAKFLAETVVAIGVGFSRGNGFVNSGVI